MAFGSLLGRNLGLLDNPLGVALPQAAFGLPMTIIILRPFFHSIPTELSMVPALVFYAFAERHLIRGLTSGAVKG